MSTYSDKYKVDRELGRGAYGTVYKASSVLDSTNCALKCIRSGGPDPEITAARMRREIEVMRALSHSNIMPIIEFDPESTWFVMPVANGVLKNLRNEFAGVQQKLQLFQMLAAGLECAHSAGYIHRDLHPSNILRIGNGPEQRWVIADWGIVRRPHGLTGTPLTAQGDHAMGMEGWAAPELDDPRQAHAATFSSDVYSLGALLAWLETGEAPRKNRSPTVPPTSAFFSLVAHATHQDANRRLQSVAAFRDRVIAAATQNQLPARLSDRLNSGDLTAIAELLAFLNDENFDEDAAVRLVTGMKRPAVEHFARTIPEDIGAIAKRLGDLTSMARHYSLRRSAFDWFLAVCRVAVETSKQRLLGEAAMALFDSEPNCDQASFTATPKWIRTLQGWPSDVVFQLLQHNAAAREWYSGLTDFGSPIQQTDPRIAALFGQKLI